MKVKNYVLLLFLLFFCITFSHAQEQTVTGVITAKSDNLPIPGVNVVVKGTARGVQTDFDGKYAIKASKGEVLVFSYVGLKTTEIMVTGDNTVNLIMEDDVSSLEEVIVTAYGTAKRAEVTGSVAVVEAETFEQVPIGSFDLMLRGQAPGLFVSSGSGQPGTSGKIRIRGTGSINGGATPLFVLDGTPITGSDFATLNPNDFESVSILKDAASTSIYGSRGANGVIVITTKKGRAGVSTVKYSTQYGISQIGETRFDMMDAREKMIFDNILDPGTWTDLDIANAETTDWTDFLFRTGVTQTHDFSVSGGTEKTRFYTSLSYFDQDGIGIRSKLQRFSVRLNLDHDVSEKFKVGVNSSIAYSKSSFISSEGGININNPFAAIYLAQPYDTPFNEDDSFNTGISEQGNTLIGGNALENLAINGNSQNDLKIVASAYGELEFAKNLTAKVYAGIDYIDRELESFASPNTFFGTNAGFQGDEGGYSLGSDYIANITLRHSLNYSNIFNDVHSVNASVFMEYFKRHRKTGSFQGFGIDPKLIGYAAGITDGTEDNGFIPQVGGFVSQRGLLSFFADATYSYDSRYNLNLSYRRDASSRFAETNRWGSFYSIGVGWNITNESFFNVDWVNNLKFRASYGTVGNETGIGDFQSEDVYSLGSYNGQNGLIATSVGNNQLQWEESAKFNVGLDFGLFNNRLFGSVDYYVDNVSNLFISQQLSATSGFGSIDSNVGEMQNKGVDLALNGTVLQTKDFSWNLNFNVNYNKNEITNLGQESEYELGTSIIREGLPFGSHFEVGWAGVNPANGEPLYLDINGNVTNVYSEENRLAIWGSSEPIWTGGFGTNINYKGFSLSAAFSFVADYFLTNNQNFFLENPNFNNFNQLSEMLTIWQQPGDVTDIQSAAFNREFSSKDIEDASYVRLTNLVFAYNFSEEALDRINFITGLRLYVQGTNLYTWTNYSGFDPEDANNISQFEYPLPTTVTFGMDINF